MNMRQELIRLALDNGSGGGSDITVTELKVDENGTYEKEGYAFSPVIVDVPTEATKFTDLSYFYASGARLSDVPPSELDASNAISVNHMFTNCISLTSIEFGDKFDTSNVTNMASMFYNCAKLTSIELGDKFDTSNVTTMDSMLYGCKLLESIDFGDKFDTSNVTTMSNMFYNCPKLTSIDFGDRFDTSKVTTMTYMFYNCTALTSLDFGDRFDTSNVTNIGYMFNRCSALSSLDLSGWDTNKVTSIGGLIVGCTSLKDIYIRDSELRSDGKLKFKLPSAGVFDQIRTNVGHIHLSATLQSEYETATNWTAYTDIIVFDLP